MTKQIDEWTKTAARYRSEPEAAGGKGEGTVELARRAIEEQNKRDDCARQVSSLRGRVGRVPDRHRAGVGDRHHRHGGAELSRRRASALLGLGFMAIGLFAPHAVHLF